MSNLATYRAQGYLVLEDDFAKPRDLKALEIALGNNLQNSDLPQSSCAMKLLTSRDIMSSVGLILTTDSEANHKIEIKLINHPNLSDGIPGLSEIKNLFKKVENCVLLIIVFSSNPKVRPINILPKNLSREYQKSSSKSEIDRSALITPEVKNRSAFFLSQDIIWEIRPEETSNPHSLLLAHYSAPALY